MDIQKSCNEYMRKITIKSFVFMVCLLACMRFTVYNLQDLKCGFYTYNILWTKELLQNNVFFKWQIYVLNNTDSF